MSNYRFSKIDHSGLHIWSYNEVISYLVEEARRIYGRDIYLENDSQDYQFISLMADCMHDLLQRLQEAHNNQSPRTATGAALDGLVLLNGIRRKGATHSTAIVTLKASPRTSIINGIIADDRGLNWLLPPEIIFGDEQSSIDVLATCTVHGRITAPANTLTNIITPTSGWASVTNPEPAIAGQAVETQEQLRARQTISTARPSRTVIEGLIGGLAEIPDVTRHRVYENDTNVFGFFGVPIPGHSICAVVEGGVDEAIAQEIHLRKTPGCGTYGDVVVNIVAGEVLGEKLLTPIRFFRPAYYDIKVELEISRLEGFSTATEARIREAVVNHLNALEIGEDVLIWPLNMAIAATAPQGRPPTFTIVKTSVGIDELNSFDFEIPFNAAARGFIDNVGVIFV